VCVCVSVVVFVRALVCLHCVTLCAMFVCERVVCTCLRVCACVAFGLCFFSFVYLPVCFGLCALHVCVHVRMCVVCVCVDVHDILYPF